MCGERDGQYMQYVGMGHMFYVNSFVPIRTMFPYSYGEPVEQQHTATSPIIYNFVHVFLLLGTKCELGYFVTDLHNVGMLLLCHYTIKCLQLCNIGMKLKQADQPCRNNQVTTGNRFGHGLVPIDSYHAKVIGIGITNCVIETMQRAAP